MGVVYVPLSLTVTVSVSTVPDGPDKVNVIVPVGSFPPDRTAVSVRVVWEEEPKVMVFGVAVVTSVGLAGSCSGAGATETSTESDVPKSMPGEPVRPVLTWIGILSPNLARYCPLAVRLPAEAVAVPFGA